jgi:lipoprotein NlpI
MVCLVVFAAGAGAGEEELARQAQAAAAARDFEKAAALATRAIEGSPESATLYLLRGTYHFRAGRVEESLADFERHLKLRPGDRAEHWQRGIALYYAGRFKEGREQFEEHRTVNPDDVENAAWHYLCHAREASPQKARDALLPVGPDGRVPMAEVYQLFAGKLKAEDVLAAARKGNPPAGRLNRHLFYAHLYIALWHEAQGENELAERHMRTAVEKHPLEDYMYDVARVHLSRMKKPATRPAK